MRKEVLKFLTAIILFVGIVAGGMIAISSIKEQTRDAHVSVSIQEFEKNLNQHLVSDGMVKVSNVTITPYAGKSVKVNFDVEAYRFGTQVATSAEIKGTIGYGAFRNHFLFYSDSLTLKNFRTIGNSKEVQYVEDKNKKDDFGKQIKAAIENSFATLKIEEMSEPLSGWTWLNSVTVNKEQVTVQYSFAQSTKTFFIGIGVVILCILLLVGFAYCPECFFFAFIFSS